MKYKSKFKKRKTYEERMKILHFKKKSIYDGERQIRRKHTRKIKEIDILQDDIREDDSYFRPFKTK